MLRPTHLILLSVLCCSCSQQGRIEGVPRRGLEAGPSIDVVFNHQDHARYRSPLNSEWRSGDDLEQFLIDAINSAETSVLVAVQELTLPKLAHSLIAAHHGGRQVKIVLENTYSAAWSEQQLTHLPPHQRQRWLRLNALADANGDGTTTPEEAHAGDAIALLKQAGVPMVDDTEDGSRGSGLMHHKFVVIDEQIVITGSANFTNSGIHGDAGAPRTRGNVNHLIRVDSAELAAIFRQQFDQLWGDGPGGSTNSRFGRGKDAAAAQKVAIGSTTIEVLFTPHASRDPNHGLNWLAK